MIKDSILDLLALVGGFIAIGTLIDTLFLDSDKAKELYTAATRKERGLKIAFREYVNLGYDLIFLRFFGTSPLSARYVLRASAISSIFVSLIFSMQIASGEKIFSDVPISGFEISFFVSLVIANVIIDWLSIFQTQVFMSFSSRARGLTESFIAIIADVFVSIKLFMFVYAGAVLLILYIFVSYVFNQTLADNPVIFRMTIEKSSSTQAEDYFEGQRAFEYRISMNRVNKSLSDENTVYISLRIFSSEKYLDPLMFFNTLSYNGSIKETSAFLGRGLRKDEASDAVFDRVKTENNIIYTAYANVIVDKIDVKLSWYSRIWFYVDLVEDAFVNMISTDYVSFSVEEALGLRYGFTPFFSTNLCSIGSLVYGERYAMGVNLGALGGCDPDIFVLSGYIASSETALLQNNYDLLNAKIPLNTFFMSSLLLTLVAYFFIISFFIFGVANYGLRIVPPRVERIFVRAPFSIGGVIIGVIVWLVTL